MYPEFCAFAHTIDQKLAQLGASQLTPVGEGDELNGQEEAFRTWAVSVFKVTAESCCWLSSLCFSILWHPTKIRGHKGNQASESASAV